MRSKPQRLRPVTLSAADISGLPVDGPAPRLGTAVVCRAATEAPYDYLLGSPGPRADAAAPIKTWLVPCDEHDAARIRQAGTPAATPLEVARAVSLLRHAALPSIEIAALFGLHSADITRLARIDRAGDRLKKALDKGQLSPAHARLLAPLPLPLQDEWTARAVAAHWTSRQLAAAMADSRQSRAAAESPDLGAFAAQLGERLGTKVGIEWPASPSSRRVTLDWYTPEDLKGLMARLSAGPDHEAGKPTRRELVLQIRDAAELAALTDHLLEGQVT